LVVDALVRDGRPSRLVVIETAGDRRAPDTAWGEGAFVAAIEQSLRDRRVDVAVHSAKDVPIEEPPGLRVAAFLPRADARDALVVAGDTGTKLADLPAGTRVGTDSPRRAAFVLAHRPDLVVMPIHGNVDTRLRRLDDGEADALILACAGLDRLGRGDRIAERLDPEVVPPAPGQGAIAVQIRHDDARMLAFAAAIDHRPTRLTVEAERAFLAASGGGCRSPIGALAEIDGDALTMLGGYASALAASARFARRSGGVGDGAALAVALATDLATEWPDRGSLA
jgi:hydroxymethylbilane synthase